MNVKPQRTAAETALLSAFEERAKRLPGDADVARSREAAMALLDRGLPSRRVEAWHYTDLRRLLPTVPGFAEGRSAEALAPLLDGSAVLPVSSGETGQRPELPEGVSAVPLGEALAQGRIGPLNVRGMDDAIGALNAAFAAGGWVVEIADGTRAERAVEFQNANGDGQSHSRFVAHVGAGADVTLVERQTGAGFATSVSHLSVGAGAKVRWLIVQDKGEGAAHLGQFNAEIGADAELTVFVMNAGGRLVRQEINVKAAGEGGSFTLRGINLLSGETHSDVTMVLDHAVPNTTSTEIIRNVVTDRAHGVFQGRINVFPDAQKTDARMACNTLLLSDQADFSTKPELEIFADDVACGHGATVTEIDRNHLFYLMARGIDEKTARGLLVKAFVAEVIEDLEDEAVVAPLEARLDAWFRTHG